MSAKPKILGTLAIKRSETAGQPSKQTSQTMLPSNEELTDERALEIATNSLSKVCDAISKKEEWVIKSLIAYTANREHLDEETVQAILFAHLDVEEIEDVTKRHYVTAVNYLVDFDISKILN